MLKRNRSQSKGRCYTETSKSRGRRETGENKNSIEDRLLSLEIKMIKMHSMLMKIAIRYNTGRNWKRSKKINIRYKWTQDMKIIWQQSMKTETP